MQHTHEILEKIKTYQTIILHRHMNPDPDAIGSQVGLKEIIQTNFPDKKVLATGLMNQLLLGWLAWILSRMRTMQVPWSLSAILPTPLASMTNATQVAIF